MSLVLEEEVREGDALLAKRGDHGLRLLDRTTGF
jgi:hypothetical protein